MQSRRKSSLYLLELSYWQYWSKWERERKKLSDFSLGKTLLGQYFTKWILFCFFFPHNHVCCLCLNHSSLNFELLSQTWGKNVLFLKIMLVSLASYSKNYLHLIWEEKLWIKKKIKQQNQPKKEISVIDQISLFDVAQSNNYRLFIEI